MTENHINCNNDHQHKHEHENHCDECHDFIEITTHESSIIGSFQFRLDKAFEDAHIYVENKLKLVADAIIDAGGIIGHIKAFVISDGKSCMLSITDDVINKKKYNSSEHAKVNAAAIVFCITPHQLSDILHNIFGDDIKDILK